MAIVTYRDMKKALENSVGKKGNMSEEGVSKLAEYVLSFFGFAEEFIDNRLGVEDRDVFYMLEEEGILSTRREEIIVKGHKNPWRIHYWVLRTDHIKQLANNGHKEEKEISVYDAVLDEVWARSSIK